MVGLMAHCGTRLATLDELKDMGAPEGTRTYSPLGHYEFVYSTHSLGDEILEPGAITLIIL